MNQDSSSLILGVQQLSKSYSNREVVPVLRDVSFSAHAGEILCVLGASGCGKSTLLKILSGLEPPDRGEVSSSLERPGPLIGYLPQGERLFEWRNVIRNVALPGEMLGWPRVKALTRAEELLQLVGLQGLQQARVEELSGGMTQRALLARTFLTNPKMLLLDEPLGQLDLVGRRDLAQILREFVASTGACAVVVSHSVEEAVFLADKILILSKKPASIVGRFSRTALEHFTELDPKRAYEQVLETALPLLAGGV